MTVLLLAILFLAILLWILGWSLLARAPRCAPASTAAGSISVIIPARDEAGSLPTLLASLAAQAVPPLEVIVADDDSNDGTAELAAAAGARVIFPGPKPPGWRGKTWPCFRAADEASGELLVFLDADTRLAPDGLARLAASLERQGGGLLSVEPHHDTARAHEQLSAFFNLLRAGSVGGTPGDRTPDGAFGPCLVIRRDEYLELGGHGRPEVRGQILENFFLGQALLREGRRVGCCQGEGVVSMRMYPGGLAELALGWSKAFVTGASASRGSFLLRSSLWLSGAAIASLALPLALLSGSGAIGLALAALLHGLYAFQLRGMLRKVGRFSAWTSVLFPIPLLAFFAIFLRSVYLVRVRRRVSWKGQTITPERRPAC